VQTSRAELSEFWCICVEKKKSSREDSRRRRPFRLRLRGKTAIRRGLSAGWRLMANEIKTKPAEDVVPEKRAPETAPDSPLLDLSDPAVKKLIRSAKKRGYVTHDQITVLSSEEVNSEQMEDVLAILSEMGVKVVETEEASEEGEHPREEADEEAESEGGDLVEVQQKVPAKAEAKEPTERTDDPVRMYLRDIG